MGQQVQLASVQPDASSIAALEALGILDSAPEAVFDALVHAASALCGTPISLISLLDERRQWFKANVGLAGVTETPRDVAFCAHAVLEERLLEVPDAASDARFAGNPLVTGDPNIRFYAGMPIQLPGGHQVGTLCVIDRVPRQLTEDQRTGLRSLTEAVAQALQWRHAMVALRDANATLDEERRKLAATMAALSKSEQVYRAITQHLPNAAVMLVDRSLRYVATDGAALANVLAYYNVDSLVGRNVIELVSDANRDAVRDIYARAFAGESVNTEMRRGDFFYDVNTAPIYQDGDVAFALVVLYDVTSRKAELARLQRNETFLDRTGRLARVGGWQLELSTGAVDWSDEACRIRGVPSGHLPTRDEAIASYAEEARPAIRAAVDRCVRDGVPWDLELPLVRADGQRIWVRTMGSVDHGTDSTRRLVGAIQDISEQVAQRQALADANERISVATDSGGIGIWELNLSGRTVHWDPWMYRLFGLPPEGTDISYARWAGALLPHSLAAIEHAAGEALAGRSPFDLEFEIVWPDGSSHYLRSAARVIRDKAGRGVRLVGANWDVTKRRMELAELEAARSTLEHHAADLRSISVTDDLTGLLNRRGFMLVAGPTLQLAARNREKRTLAFLDLNGMKTINDTLGHEVGDLALIETANVMRKVFRSSDVLSRLGGDEFVALVNAGEPEAIDAILRRVKEAVAEVNAGAGKFRLSLSVGTAMFDGTNPMTVEQLLAEADARMYEQKRNRLPSMRIKIIDM